MIRLSKDYISVTGNFLAKLCHENFGQYIKLSDYTKHIEGKIRSTFYFFVVLWGSLRVHSMTFK